MTSMSPATIIGDEKPLGSRDFPFHILVRAELDRWLLAVGHAGAIRARGSGATPGDPPRAIRTV